MPSPGPAGADQLTGEGVIAGTWYFMSPEQASGDSHAADQRSDIFGLGATGYYLLTGDLPRLVRFRADVPADLQEIVLRCLEEKPEQRFQTAEELETALANCACAALWDQAKAAAWWELNQPKYAEKG